MNYDAVVVVSFGGPEGRPDVLPFLENVLRGRHVPRERLLAVAEHYYHFNGISPINAANRAIVAALERELAARGPHLPVYFGNRNWHPLLTDTVATMARDGIRNALALVTSAFGSYSGCRQYLEDIARAQAQTPNAPQIDKLRLFADHPAFTAIMADRVRVALNQLPGAEVVFTAHSIPLAMASSGPYVSQLLQSCAAIATELRLPQWRLAYQSRSGAPGTPWLEPDILTVIDEMHAAGKNQLVIAPLGFLSNHMEVLYDLDTEAHERCAAHGMQMQRAGTAGDHPAFPALVRELIVEKISGQAPPDCLATCCQPQRRPPSATES